MRALTDDVDATLARLTALHPDLQDELDKAYGYVVFPSVGRASVLLGVSFGRGLVFDHGTPIGTATISELTLGVQVGGQTFSELILLPDKAALDRLRRSEVAFAANASAVMVKAAASGTSDFHGVVARAYSRGGMLLELSIGGQKLTFSPGNGVSGVHPEIDAGQEGEEEQPQSLEAGEEHPEEDQWQEDTGNPDWQADEEPSASDEDEWQAEADESEPQYEAAEADPPSEEADAQYASDDQAAEDESQPEAEAAEEEPRRGVLARLRSGARTLGQRIERHVPKAITKRVGAVTGRVRKGYQALLEEQTVSKMLHPDAQAALTYMLERDFTLRERLEKAAGFAIFPSVGKADLVVGVAYGRGEVFERNRLVGYAAFIQLTLGVQVGGDTFAVLVIMDDENSLKELKQSRVSFAANASMVMVKAGLAGSKSYRGAPIRIASPGGMLLELALGGQKVVYRAAALTRGKSLRLDAGHVEQLAA